MGLGFCYGFPLKRELLASALRGLSADCSLSDSDLARELGVGVKKARAVSVSLLYMGLRDGKTRSVTPLGALILERDPQFRQRNTELVLHYQLSSNKQASLWYWIVNEFVPQVPTFGRSELVQRYCEDNAVRSNLKNVNGDAKVFVSAYTDGGCLAATGYLRELDRGTFSIQECQMHPLLLAYAVYDQRERHQAASATVSIGSLIHSVESPGVIYRLSRGSVDEKIRRLESAGVLDVSTSAELDNVAYTFEGSALDLLQLYYESGEDS